MAINKTFADKARMLTQKYKKRLGDDLRKFDPIAKESMNSELEQLKEEQETFKEENGLNNQENLQFKKGGKLPQYQGIGDSQLPTTTTGFELPQMFIDNPALLTQFQNAQGLNVDNIYGPNTAAAFDRTYGATGGAPLINNTVGNISDPYVTNDVEFAGTPSFDYQQAINLQTPPINAAQANLEGQPELYSPGFNYVGAGATLASGIYNYLNTPEEIEQIEAERIKGETIDLSSERVAARSRASQLRNVSRRTARGVASSAADFTNRAISGEVAASRLEGQQIASSLTREQTANAQIMNRVREFNARSQLSADAQNAQIQAMNQAGQQQQQQAIIDTATGLSQAYADYQQQQGLYNALNIQSPYYSIYEDPETGKPIILSDKQKTQ